MMNTETKSTNIWSYIWNLAGFAASNVAGLALTLILSQWVSQPAFHALINKILPLDQQTAWHLTRAVATVGYLTLTGAMAWGLILSSKIAKDITPAPITLEMHSTVSWIGVGLGAVHGYLLLFDTYYHYTIADLLVPFIGPYRPQATGLGVIALYFMYLTSASFSWRSWMGQRAWRALHYLTFGAYLLATVHGFLAGTDSKEFSMQAMYIASVLLMLFLTNYRLMAGRKDQRAAVSSTR